MQPYTNIAFSYIPNEKVCKQIVTITSYAGNVLLFVELIYSIKLEYEIFRNNIIFVMSTPGEFLKLLLGRPVVVKLNSGVDYR